MYILFQGEGSGYSFFSVGCIRIRSFSSTDPASSFFEVLSLKSLNKNRYLIFKVLFSPLSDKYIQQNWWLGKFLAGSISGYGFFPEGSGRIWIFKEQRSMIRIKKPGSSALYYVTLHLHIQFIPSEEKKTQDKINSDILENGPAVRNCVWFDYFFSYLRRGKYKLYEYFVPGESCCCV